MIKRCVILINMNMKFKFLLNGEIEIPAVNTEDIKVNNFQQNSLYQEKLKSNDDARIIIIDEYHEHLTW